MAFFILETSETAFIASRDTESILGFLRQKDPT